MAIEDSVPSGVPLRPGREPVGVPACPSCAQAERVHAVPALYESARATEETVASARRTINDDDASSTRKRAARERLAATPPALIRSSLLAPAPKTHFGGYLAGAVFFALPAGGLWAEYRSSEDFANSTGLESVTSGDSVMRAIAIACMVICGCLLAATLWALVRRHRVGKGRAAADAVWRRGWYCTRCGVVHFRAGEQPVGADADRALSPDEFRHMVWKAGGYAKGR